MNKPEYVKVDNKKYKINTDFRIAIACNQIAQDSNISDYERALAIIYKLFGDEGLECENQNKLLELATKYLLLNKTEKDLKSDSDNKFELDFMKCQGLIESSFKFDYNYNPYDLEYLHYYDFYTDLENLSSSEFGTCCVLNRIINILNMETKDIKDKKQVENIKRTQAELRKKYCVDKKSDLDNEEKTSVMNLYKSLGLWKGE